MNKKQKKMLWRIIVSAVLMVALHFVPVTGLIRFALYMVPYFIVGYDILWKAVLGIWNRQVFDENFLMAVATVGAIVIGLKHRNLSAPQSPQSLGSGVINLRMSILLITKPKFSTVSHSRHSPVP